MSCEDCHGTGFVVEEREGRGYATRCQCQRVTPQGEDALIRACRIPPRYEECSLSTFEGFSPSLSAAVEKCLLYCNGFPHTGSTDEGLGLLFSGDTGVGKTHLAVAVLRELVETRHVSGQFWDFHGLIREIKRSYDSETKMTELQVLEPVIETQVLVLDDLGAWKMTDWMNDTLFYILNGRYLAKRATIITTNYQDATRETVLAADSLRRREYLVERIGNRLRSRLMEMCLVIRIESTDYRQARQVSNQAALRTPGT